MTKAIKSESKSMAQTLVVTTVEAVEASQPGTFEVRLTLHDSSTVTLVMDGPTLCSLADQASQYATPEIGRCYPTANAGLPDEARRQTTSRMGSIAQHDSSRPRDVPYSGIPELTLRRTDEAAARALNVRL